MILKQTLLNRVNYLFLSLLCVTNISSVVFVLFTPHQMIVEYFVALTQNDFFQKHFCVALFFLFLFTCCECVYCDVFVLLCTELSRNIFLLTPKMICFIHIFCIHFLCEAAVIFPITALILGRQYILCFLIVSVVCTAEMCYYLI